MYRHGKPSSVVATLAAEVGASAVYVSGDHSPYGRARDAEVARALDEAGTHLVEVGTPYAVQPGAVVKADGRPYSVFSPFSRAWRRHRWPEPGGVPEVDWCGAPSVPCDGPPDLPQVDIDFTGAGEAAAHAQWEAFLPRIATYKEDRDLPALDGTSRLSAALKWGLVHPRQLLADLGTRRRRRVLRQRVGLARVLRRRAAPPAPESGGRTSTAEWTRCRWTPTTRARSRIEEVGGRAHRLPDRRRRHAPAAGHRVDAQPSAHGGGELPGQGPAPAVAVGRPTLHASPGRRRPGLEQPRLAVGGRHRHRCRALLPHLQPHHPRPAFRPRRRLRAPLGARAGGDRGAGGARAGRCAGPTIIRRRWSTTRSERDEALAPVPQRHRWQSIAWTANAHPPSADRPEGDRCSTNARPPS